jgi:glycerophosphoryl diester phosphodiesterase
MSEHKAWPFPRIVAHRGGGTLAPENTLAGMLCGLMHGFHAVEFDVMCAADGIPVLMHDDKLGRTIAGSGSVAEYTARELQAMDAGGWKAAQFAGEPVPMFSQVIDFCCANGIWMNVEIKPVPGFEVVTGQAAAATLQAYLKSRVLCSANTAATPLFSSFSFDALMAAKQTAPEIQRGYLMDKVMDDWRDKLQQLGAVALHTNHRYLTPEMATAIKDAGYGLFCYTVNDPERAREILGWGVDGFCTDRIDLIPADFA